MAVLTHRTNRNLTRGTCACGRLVNAGRAECSFCRGGVRVPPTSHICPRCGEAFLGNAAKRYCSAACYLKFHRNSPPPPVARKCKGCDTIIPASASPLKVYCDRHCYNRWYRNPTSAMPTRILACPDCQSPVETRATHDVRCEPCRAKVTDARNRRKSGIRRGLRVGVPISVAEIGDRDGWKCHLCRKSVDRTLSGTLPQGPTVDHLIPISAGGLDELRNVALAHRSCNLKRYTGGNVQLRIA